MIVAVIVVIVLILMVIAGIILLVIVGKSDEGYDTSVWTNKTGWGSGLLGVGLIGLFAFGSGVMMGKASGMAGGIMKMLKSK